MRTRTRSQREAITTLPELTFNYPQQTFDELLFPANEKAAMAKLRQFCKQGAGEYDARRDFPAIEGTSRLSASGAGRTLSSPVFTSSSGRAAAGDGRWGGFGVAERTHLA